MMTIGSLFSGIGGFDLGFQWAGYQIAWQVEKNHYCRNMLRRHWPSISCHYDITALDWNLIAKVDLVCAGFPCQPFSSMGKRRGAADDRYLWPEVLRCLSILRPAWFIGENVPGLISMGLDQILADLEDLGYAAQAIGIPACAVDAPHLRERIWILAYAARKRCHQERQNARTKSQKAPQMERRGSAHRHRWPAEPDVDRVADGIPHRVDRVRALGNAVVPQIVEQLGLMIRQVSHEFIA